MTGTFVSNSTPMPFNFSCTGTILEERIVLFLDIEKMKYGKRVAGIIDYILSDNPPTDSEIETDIRFLKDQALQFNDSFYSLILGFLEIEKECYRAAIGYFEEFTSHHPENRISKEISQLITLIQISELRDYTNIDDLETMIGVISSARNVSSLLWQLNNELNAPNHISLFEKLVRKAIALYPGVFRLHNYQAWIYRQQDQPVYFRLAIKEYNRVIEGLHGEDEDSDNDIHNELAETYHNIALCYSMLPGEYQKALMYCDLALEEDSKAIFIQIEQEIRKTKALIFLNDKGFEKVHLAEKEVSRLFELDEDSMDAKKLLQKINLKKICLN